MRGGKSCSVFDKKRSPGGETLPARFQTASRRGEVAPNQIRNNGNEMARRVPLFHRGSLGCRDICALAVMGLVMRTYLLEVLDYNLSRDK